MTQEQIETLIEKYFDCTATDEEEATLQRSLPLCPWHSEAIDEAMAVMGYTAVGAQLHKAQQMKHSTHIRRLWQVSAAAAVIAIAAGGSLYYQNYRHSNVCVAFVNGERVTDSKSVMALMRSDLSSVQETHESVEANVREQLSLMNEGAAE